MSAEERKFVLGRYRVKFATDEFDTIAVPGLDDLSLREPRVVPPASVAPFARPTAMIASRTPTASIRITSGQCLAITIMRPTLWPGVPLELCRYVDGKPSPARRAEIALIVADIRRRVDHRRRHHRRPGRSEFRGGQRRAAACNSSPSYSA